MNTQVIELHNIILIKGWGLGGFWGGGGGVLRRDEDMSRLHAFDSDHYKCVLS